MDVTTTLRGIPSIAICCADIISSMHEYRKDIHMFHLFLPRLLTTVFGGSELYIKHLIIGDGFIYVRIGGMKLHY